jgi:NADH:ubiquinone oxidoreductase subunit 2 (subunit N)
VIAFFYYARPIRAMIFHEPTTEDRTPLVVPQPLIGAIALTATIVIIVGIYPQIFARVGELAF